MLRSFSLSLGFLLLCTIVALCQTANPGTWIPNSRVTHMTRGDGKIFLSGEFDWVGDYYGAAAPILNTDLSHDSSFPKVPFAVEGAIPDGAGGWYTRTYGVIGHIKADKTVETLPITFNTSGGSIYGMALSGNILYVGGQFTSVNGTPRQYLAAIDLTTNTVTSWNPGANGSVYAVAVFGSTVYVGGSFSIVGGQTRYKIAAIDALGSTTTWNANVISTAGYVLDIVPTASAVYFGGSFTNVASASPSRTNFAAVNATSGALLTFNPRPTDIVRDLLLDGTTLYIAGQYTSIAGLSRYGLTSFDTGTGSITAFNVSFSQTYNGPITTMGIDGTNLYVGGDFRSVNNVDKARLAVLNKSTGALVPTVARNLSDYPRTICIVGAKVLIGTYNFRGITGDFSSQQMAALDETTGQGVGWVPQAPPIPSGWYLNQPTHIQFLNNRLYFWQDLWESTDGLSATVVGALDPNDGSLDPGFTVDVQGTVSAWAFTSDMLYLAGDFTQINGTARAGFAAVSLSTGALLPFELQSPPINGQDVSSIGVANNVLYVAGYFNFDDGGVSRSNLAAWDATTGELLPWAPQVTVPMYYNLYIGPIHNGKVYVTGSVAVRIHAVTGAVDTWTPAYYETSAGPGFVETVTIEGNSVIFCGGFSPGLTRVGIVSGSRTTWQPSIYDVYSSEGQVSRAVVSGNKLFVGGNFTFDRADGVQYHLAQFDLPAETPNEPPQVVSSANVAPSDGVLSIDLTSLISDPDDNLDLSTLSLLSDVSYQGASASIDASHVLTLDYGGPFLGTDSVTVEVCDLLEACTVQTIAIQVGDFDLLVYNAVSPNGDGLNDEFILQNISPGNHVTILNRWGAVVFEMDNYDNQKRIFRGLSDGGSELPAGTYYYRINFSDGQPTKTGFLSLRK